MEAGQYEEAIAAFEAMDGYKDSIALIDECKYRSALALMDAGNYEEAIFAFESLDGYKDSIEKAEDAYEEYKHEKLKQANVGDYVIFGAYEQDNDTSNGKEKIKWLVLDKQGSKMLVISQYALDCQPYNTEDADVTCAYHCGFHHTVVHLSRTGRRALLLLRHNILSTYN